MRTSSTPMRSEGARPSGRFRAPPPDRTGHPSVARQIDDAWSHATGYGRLGSDAVSAGAATGHVTDPAVAPDELVARSSLWTQREAAAFLRVSRRYLRDSSCPKLLLPGHGVRGRPLVRYDPASVAAWAAACRPRPIAPRPRT